jgi:hypothetical protein
MCHYFHHYTFPENKKGQLLFLGPNSVSAYKQHLRASERSTVCGSCLLVPWCNKMTSKWQTDYTRTVFTLEMGTWGDSDQTDSDTKADRQIDRWMRTASTRPNIPVIHRFMGGPSGLRLHEVPHTGKESIALSVFMLFFVEVIQMLVYETNQYYKQYVETLHEGPAPCVTWLYRKCTCSYHHLADGARQRGGLLVQSRKLFHIFTVIRWNETEFFTYWDFCISLATEINLTRQMKFLTDYGKWELYVTSWVMCMPNITA